MRAKEKILTDAGYKFDYKHFCYINSDARTILSSQWVDKVAMKNLKEVIEHWNFHFLGEVSENLKQEVLRGILENPELIVSKEIEG